MGLGVLLRLLASLQILPHLVSPTAPLPAPTVVADPPHPVYFPGERLTLRCSAPPGVAVNSYQFYNQDGKRVYTESSEPRGGPWLVMTTEVGKAGGYSCEYWTARDRWQLYSARSQPVWVPVMDLPAAPSISATASGPWDDLVTIACSFPGSYMSITSWMFRNGHIINLGVTPTPQGTLLQLHTSDPASAGSYTCSYEADVAGRKVQSRPSSPISIQLPEPPGAPSLSLTPSRTVYLPGETVTLTCSVLRGAHTVTGFQFSRDDSWTVSSRSSNIHALIVTGPGDSGSYTCAYWIRPSLWGVRSQESQPVSISVTAWPPQIPLIVWCVGAAAVFRLLLFICLCRRKKDGVTAKTDPVYINTHSGAGLALQQRSPDGQAQPATHNRAVHPSTPRGKPLMGRNPRERGKREEDADSGAGCNRSASITVYCMPTSPSSTAQQRGGNSEDTVYSELLA